MASQSIPTTFLVISDTHNLQLEENSEQPFHLPLPHVDVLLHCGDLTQCGGHSSFKKALSMLRKLSADLKLVIAGNHDLELDKEFWTTHLDEGDEVEDHDKAVEIMKGKLAKDAGVTYLDEGVHTFTLRNGANLTIYASPYSPEFGDWAFPSTGDRYNSASALNRIPDFPAIDIMMTHGPPKTILDMCPTGNAGCEYLLEALKRAQPKMHCFGHIHEGYGARKLTFSEGAISEDVAVELDKKAVAEKRISGVTASSCPHETLMVNAAIQNERGEFSNAPWLVEVMLPGSKNA